jgi:hypothetical protein
MVFDAPNDPPPHRSWARVSPMLLAALALLLLMCLFFAAAEASRGRHGPPFPTVTPDPLVVEGALLAFPNPVPPGPGSGTTVISWIVPGDKVGEIWLSIDGQPERLFARGPSGALYAPWIEAGAEFQFSLYLGTAHVGPPLRTVSVTRG